MTQIIHAASQALAEARHFSDIAAQAVIAAEGEASKLIERHAELQSKRSKIAAERSSGFDDPSHGPTLALLNMDLDDLIRLIGEAKAVVEKAKAEAATAAHNVSIAAQGLAHATSAETLQRLKPIATELLAKLDIAIQGIMAEAKTLGQRVNWTPDEAAYGRLNRLFHTKGLV